MKTIITIAAAIMALVAPAVAEENEASAAVIKIAKDYIAAYETFDPAKMEPYLADDMMFIDPTSADQNANGGPFMFEGKEAVLKGLGDYAAQYASFTVNYGVERRYESNGVVVFVAQLTYNGATKDGQTFEGTAPIVTVITVKDGKVSKHADYFDYAGNAVNIEQE